MNLVLSNLTGKRVDDPTTVIEQGWVGSTEYNTGCLIKTSRVNSISSGVVIDIGQDPMDDTWSVTVELNPRLWVRYCRLLTVAVAVGQKLAVSDYIGAAYKSMMRLEYCTNKSSAFPVRALNKQLFKNDPTPIIFGSGNLETL